MRFKFVKINFFFPWNAYKFVFDKFARFLHLFFASPATFHHRSEETQKVCVNIMPARLLLLLVGDVFLSMKHTKKVKLNYLRKYTKNSKEDEKKRHKNRRHFLNIKMMRDCWTKKNEIENFFRQHAPLHYDYRLPSLHLLLTPIAPLYRGGV